MDMKQMMRQAQKMQRELNKAQAELAEMTFEGTAGGGMVKATCTGDLRLTSLTIDPEAVDPEDVEMLQDMILAAVNEATRAANEANDSRLGSLTGGMGIPGFM